jgi:hypothetical protein
MMRGVSRFSVAAALLLLSASAASAAEDEGVAKRLTKYGQLRRGESESLSENVSKRMKRAADMTSAQDPLRMAVGKALGVTNPNDAMSAAKIRLRLYAGLNEWALENLFVPRPGGIGRCQQEFGVTLRQCEALVAAAGRVPAEEASKLAGGAPPPMPMAMAARTTQFATARPVAPPPGGSRFGKYDSGYRPASAAPVAPMARPMARPTYAVAPRPAVAPMAAAPNPNAREEYQRKRAEYLERKRLEMEARKQKIVATAGGTVPVDRGPASEEAAAAAAPAATEPVAQAKAPGAKGKAAAAEAPAEEAPAEAAPPAAEKKEALDGDLLDSLLGDPMGKK